MQNRSEKQTGTAYVVTYPPTSKGIYGHTSLLVVGPDNQSFERSFYPSSRVQDRKQFEETGGLAPIPGFNTVASNDAKYQNFPASVLEIKDLDFTRMQEEDREFTQAVQKGRHQFSRNYNNPANRHNHVTYVVSNKKSESKLTSDMLVEPFSESSTSSVEQEYNKVTLGNCTEAVERSLKAGGYKKKQPSFTESFFSMFNFGALKPVALQHQLSENGAEEILHSKTRLPGHLKNTFEAMSTAQHYQKNHVPIINRRAERFTPSDDVQQFIRPPG